MSYDPVPEMMADEKEHRRKLARSCNAVLAGKINATGTVTLTPGAAVTDIADERAGIFSFIHLMPLTASAAAALDGLWFEPVRGKVTLHHAAAAHIDRTFRYLIIG